MARVDQVQPLHRPNHFKQANPKEELQVAMRTKKHEEQEREFAKIKAIYASESDRTLGDRLMTLASLPSTSYSPVATKALLQVVASRLHKYGEEAAKLCIRNGEKQSFRTCRELWPHNSSRWCPGCA